MKERVIDLPEGSYQTKKTVRLDPNGNEIFGPASNDIEDVLENMNKEVESNKIKTEDIYKEYLEEYNKNLQIGRIHIKVNKALKDIQAIDDLVIEDKLEEKDLEKLAKSVGVVSKYLENNKDLEEYEMIKILLDQATAILELERVLKENNIDDSTKSSLDDLLSNIASKDLRNKYKDKINNMVEYSAEDEMGAEELEHEMEKNNSKKEEKEPEINLEEEIEPELSSEDEEVTTNKERYIKMPKSKLKRFEGFWKGRFGLLIQMIEELESLVNNKNTSIEELKLLYDKANDLYSKKVIQKESKKIKGNLKDRLDKINRQIENRIKAEEYEKEQLRKEQEEQLRKEQEEQLRKEQEEQLRKEQEEQLRKEQEEQLRKEQEEQLRKEQEEQLRKEQEEKIQKQKAQLEQIMKNAKAKPNLQNINAAKAYIDKFKDNRNLFENEEVVKDYIQQLDKLYEDYILNSIKVKFENMKSNPSYKNIVIVEQTLKSEELLLKQNGLYDTYLNDINNSILRYVSTEMGKIKVKPNIKKIEMLENFIINRKNNFENTIVLDTCLSTLDDLKKQLIEKEETRKRATNILETIKLTIQKAKDNPTKENIDTAKNLIRSYMYDNQVFNSSKEAISLLNELEELSKKTFKQVTEGSSTKYSDLNKFIANKESQINKLRDKEQELRGKLIDLERQTFIHPELKLEKMAPIKRELETIRKDIEYYTTQLNNSKTVLENRRHASVQKHYENLFNNDLASLSNEEIQNASSKNVDMDELQKYAQLKEKLNPVVTESITKKDVGELAADNFNASLSSAMSMRLTDVNQAERMIEDAEKVFWANRSNYPDDRLEELQNNLEVAITTIKNQKYQNTSGRTL